jgi:hypothetical protein
VLSGVDLHTNQRGVRPGPIPGTIFLDGGIFLKTMPNHLIDLPPKSSRAATTKAEVEARKQLTAQYEEREAYAFDPFGKPLPDGRRRYRGPFRTGKLNCRNRKRQQIVGRNLNHCVENSDPLLKKKCPCARTFSYGGDRETRLPRYGTQAHEDQYGLRVTVEFFNAEVKHDRGKLDRHFARISGLAKNALIVAMFTGGVNIRIIRDGYRIDPIGLGPDDPVPTYCMQEDWANSIWDAIGPLAARLEQEEELIAA